MQRIALGVEYDGTQYCGWQSQSNHCGVQDALEHAIKSIAHHEIRVHAAGRTDTGVHGLMQIIHFDTAAKRPDSAWVRGVNAYLPDDIRVLWAKVVTSDFHARFSARRRSYQYLLVNAPVAPALLATKAGWYHLPLDLSAMQQGVSHLVGEHDFSAFRASECQAKSPIRHLYHAEVAAFGNKFLFSFTANAFLQHQVRNMIGALIYIGNGKQPPSLITTLLDKKDRTLSPPTFSPNGLYLVGVDYDKQWALPQQSNLLTIL